MTVAEIPTAPRAQLFRITLGGVEYQITQRWNTPNNCWFVDIADTDGTPRLLGLMLVTGVDLLSQFAHLGIGGQMVVQTDHDADVVPNYTSLGDTGHLYYISS